MEREERQKRLKELLNQRKAAAEAFEKEQRIAEIHSLFSVNDEIEIKNQKETDRIEIEMTQRFPIASYGRITWEQVQNKLVIPKQAVPTIPSLLLARGLQNTFPVYLIVGIYQYPIIKTELQAVIENIGEIMYVGQEQWIYCPSSNYVIEFYNHSATLGWL